MAGLVGSVKSSRVACSARLSTSFLVETTCWASTRRQTNRSYGRSSDDRPAGVQVGDDIRQACYGADFLGGLRIEREVLVGEPCARDRFVAADDRVKGAEEADE